MIAKLSSCLILRVVPCVVSPVYYCALLFPLFLLSFTGNVRIADADAPAGVSSGSASGVVRIRVRTLKATESLSNLTTDAGDPIGRIVDDSLFDLTPKLEKLHFKKFDLIASQDEVVPMMKKETLYLPDGNTLSVRPLYLDGAKIGMWLKWQSSNGVKILDTRMHFHCGESMITGTDGDGDSGLVLAIDAERVKD